MRKMTTPDERVKLHERGHDNDTVQYGLEGPFEPWESDHTALVHVLWHARDKGWTLQDNADDLASLIRNSRFMEAMKDTVRQEIENG